MECLSCLFDEKLKFIEHYQKYPELIPWIGCHYLEAKKKLLLVGESHYLDTESKYHHDPIAWYEGISISEKDDRGWINTREIISNGINNNWKGASKVIFRNMEQALFESNFFDKQPVSAYTDVAFMNFFQRPAQITGETIEVSDIDTRVSNEVFRYVVNIISPDIVIFASALACKYAKKNDTLNFLTENRIQYTRTSHPGTPWWNRVSAAYNNKSGKNHFIDFINDQLERHPA